MVLIRRCICLISSLNSCKASGAFMMDNFKKAIASIHTSVRDGCAEISEISEDETVEEAIGYAFNHVLKKKGLYKPVHTVDEQFAYMKSKAYQDAYKGLPVYHFYRRNYKGTAKMMPPPRKFCIDKDGKYNVNHACPICRDEYLFFDYRNPSLIEQFLSHETDKIIPWKRSGLCVDQLTQLRAQLLKAKEHGLIKFAVPFMSFNYQEWYPWWDKPEIDSSEYEIEVDDVYKQPLLAFPTFNRDYNNDWDQYWLRHKEFMQTIRK